MGSNLFFQGETKTLVGIYKTRVLVAGSPSREMVPSGLLSLVVLQPVESLSVSPLSPHSPCNATLTSWQPAWVVPGESQSRTIGASHGAANPVALEKRNSGKSRTGSPRRGAAKSISPT